MLGKLFLYGALGAAAWMAYNRTRGRMGVSRRGGAGDGSFLPTRAGPVTPARRDDVTPPHDIVPAGDVAQPGTSRAGAALPTS
jgi:hypothetical protein